MGKINSVHSKKQILNVFLAGLVLVTLLGAQAGCGASGVVPTQSAVVTGSATLTHTPQPGAAALETSTPLPTLTVTPRVEQAAQPQAWADGALDLGHFQPLGPLVLHFNTPMSAESSATPLLVWPALAGSSIWDETFTTLSFTPAAALESRKNYTFFLDPLLRATNGKALKDASQWTVRAQNGLKVASLVPDSGLLNKRYPMIEVHFNRPMSSALPEGVFSIMPQVAVKLNWKDEQVLQITPQQPLSFGERYDLSLRGGAGGLLAADGAVLDEDFRWFYIQAPLEVNARMSDSQTLEVNTNYSLDQIKSQALFAITPTLAGEWKWLSFQKAVFRSTAPIPAVTPYVLTFNGPLVDLEGAGLSVPSPVQFSGPPPLRLLEKDFSIERDRPGLVANPELASLRIEFDLPVEHESADGAFSLSPAMPGRFEWEKAASGAGEVLVYRLAEKAKPGSYTVKIDPAIRDASGAPLISQPYRQTFQISERTYTYPSFGLRGENIQVLETGGSRKLQFADAGPDGDVDIAFAAYRFDLIDFAGLYAGHYGSRSYTGFYDFPLPEGAKPVLTWSNISRSVVIENRRESEIAETTLPSELGPGLYVFNLLYRQRVNDQMLVVVTRNRLVVKHEGDELFVWLTDMRGKNVPEAEIRVYSQDGVKMREGRTDENGQYRVSIPGGGTPGQTPELVSARVRKPGQPEDVSLSGFTGWNFRSADSYYFWDYSDEYYARSERYLIYPYTESPVYRPGQTVNFKVILRKNEDARYSLLPEDTPVRVCLQDGRGNTLQSLELFTNRFGTLNGSVDLPEDAIAGDYSILSELEDVSARASFKVESNLKADYQVRLTALSGSGYQFVSGDEIEMRASVAYHSGKALVDARLEIKLFNPWLMDSPPVFQGDLLTDANGNATFSFAAPYDPESYYADEAMQPYRLEVSVADGSQQTVSDNYSFSVLPAAEKLELNIGGAYLVPDRSFTVSASVLDLQGAPVAGRALTLSASAWDKEKHEFGSDAQNFTLTTDAAGLAGQELSLGAGYYELTLRGEDARGNEMKTSSHRLYVFKDGSDWFRRSKDEELLISAEKESYKPYEKARFAIESTFSGPAMLSFERGSVINTKLIELTAPLTIIESDIIPEHAPNVFVAVSAWQPASPGVLRSADWAANFSDADAYLRQAETEIRVESGVRALKISIQTDKQSYAPREKVNATIQVQDAEGRPVLAELSLAVVDEAIYASEADDSDPIFTAFYGPREHTVGTFDSFEPMRVVTMRNGPSGGYNLLPVIDTDFLEASIWLPGIETDASGQASLSFELPEGSATWRLSVKALTIKQEVGQAQVNLLSKKDIFIQAALPRVLTSGDRAELTALVHNIAEEARVVSLHFSADGLDVQSANAEQITLQPGETRAVSWQVLVRGAKTTRVNISVNSAEGSLDAISVPLLLQPAAIKDVKNQSGEFSGSLNLSLPLPTLEKQTSQVRLTLNRSLSGMLLNGLEYLNDDPYGSAEQTMSKALANAVVAQAGIGDPGLRASLARLYGQQHNDGGWGWWVDDISDDYQTAWVLFGLGVIQDAGVKIDPWVLESGAKWLHGAMGQSDFDPRKRAYALYSLALVGQGDLPATQALAADSAQELDPFSQAALALALKRLGKTDQAQDVLQSLSLRAVKNAEEVFWSQPNDDGEYQRKTMSSSLRATALALLAYNEIDPHNPLLPGVVNYLVARRQGLNGWGSTNETSFAILALKGYLANQEAEAGETPFEVLLNGKSLFSGVLDAGQSGASLELPLSALNQGLNALQITSQGGHKLYYDLSTRYDLLQSSVAAAGTLGVTRSYLDPQTNRELDELRVGQLVRVAVIVNLPEDASFMAVEDYLPGGLEALDQGLNALNNESYYPDYGDYDAYQQSYWEDYGYNYKEIRAGRVSFFVTGMGAGEHTFIYYARVTSSGQFTALPARAYAMYDPALWGRSTQTEFVVLGSR